MYENICITYFFMPIEKGQTSINHCFFLYILENLGF